MQNLSSVNDFIVEIEKEKLNLEENILGFLYALDKLAIEFNKLPNLFDDKDYDDSPELNYKKIRDHVYFKYEFGPYYIAKNITDITCKNEAVIGDSIDDIVDIYIAMKEVQYLLKNTSYENAVWYFKNGFKTHWGLHLRSLSLFLHEMVY